MVVASSEAASRSGCSILIVSPDTFVIVESEVAFLKRRDLDSGNIGVPPVVVASSEFGLLGLHPSSEVRDFDSSCRCCLLIRGQRKADVRVSGLGPTRSATRVISRQPLPHPQDCVC